MATALHRRDTQVGRIAAGDVVISKQIFNRQAPRPSSAPRLRAPTFADVPRLFSGHEATDDESGWQHRVGRLSSAALVYSADKTDLRQADRLLRGSDSAEFAERALLNKLHNARAREKLFATDRSCPHCRLLYSTLYCEKTWKNFPPIQVVHHNKDAKVIVEFDPDTCISKGEVKNFQLIVPQEIGRQMINLAHPLDWAKVNDSFFKSISAVNRDGSTGEFTGPPEKVKKDWEGRLYQDKVAYTLEKVEWPINQNLRSNAENILKITNFDRKGEDAIQYHYSLQRCVRTNFGVAWEPSGFDIDGGTYEGSRIALVPDEITPDRIKSGQLPLGHLRKRDVLELRTKSPMDWGDLFETQIDKELYAGWPEEDKAGEDQIAPVVADLVRRLEFEWKPLKFELLTLRLSKRLHFTVPEYSPIELWHLLTWTAPALLFTFLNAVCEAPHFLVKQLNKQPLSGVVTNAD